jgi:hypothetical protein
MRKSIVASLPILVTLILPANSASVQYNEVGGRTKELFGLFTDKDCSPAPIQGKIVKRILLKMAFHSADSCWQKKRRE